MSKLAKIKECVLYSEFVDKRLSETTIRRLIKSNILDYVEENGVFLINKQSFIDYIDNKKEKSTKKRVKTDLSNKEINQDLFINIDWFQVTFYSKKKSYFSFLEIQNLFMNLLYIKSTDIVYHEKGYNNYQKMLEYSGIFLMYGDEKYNHCNLQLKGEGCRILYKSLCDNNEDWYSFFNKIKELKGKVTRMDIAIDDYTPIFELEELQQKIEKQEIKTTLKTFKFVKDLNYSNQISGMTIYLGSNKSDVYYRFYKKGVELDVKNNNSTDNEIQNFNRYEIVLKDKKANSILKKYIVAIL